jgi:hypothetical protein
VQEEGEALRGGREGGVTNPLMKLAEMYFWQLGLDREMEVRGA